MSATRLIAFCLAILVASSAAASENAPGKAELLDVMMADHVRPLFSRLHDRARHLGATVENACAGQADPATDEVKDAFRDLLDIWMEAEPVRFGPVMRNDRAVRIHYWPDRNSRGVRQIRKLLLTPLSELPDAEAIARGSVALQGLPMLEYLFWSASRETPEQRARVCALARAVSGHLSALSQRMEDEWNAYRPADPDRDMQSLLRGVVEELERVTELKLRRPLGTEAGKARPKRAENWRSGSTMRNVAANLHGASRLMSSLSPAYRADPENNAYADSVIEQLDFTSRFALAVEADGSEPFTSQVPRGKVAFLASQVHIVRETIAAILAPALGVAMGFNSQDGD